MAGPSEFGGNGVKKNGVFPSPHVPTVNERVMLLYRTGDDSGLTMPDDGENFAGLLPAEIQLALRTAEGVMAKGEVWEEMETAAAQEIAALATTEGVESVG